MIRYTESRIYICICLNSICLNSALRCLLGCPSAWLLQVLGEFQLAAGGKALTMGGGSMQVGHVAHLAGAAVGVLLVLLVARLPDPEE